jgi:hypothetical protein
MFRKSTSACGNLFIVVCLYLISGISSKKCWFTYHHMEDQAMDPKDSGAQDPYRALLFKLTGVGIQRPRLRSAVNTWRKTQRIAIEHEVKRVVTRDGTHRSQLAKLRDAIARKMFERLPAESQKYWGDRAKEEHEAALKRWKDDTTGKPSKDPVARQQ